MASAVHHVGSDHFGCAGTHRFGNAFGLTHTVRVTHADTDENSLAFTVGHSLWDPSKCHLHAVSHRHADDGAEPHRDTAAFGDADVDSGLSSTDIDAWSVFLWIGRVATRQ